MSGVIIFINKRSIAPIVLAESIPSYVVGRISEQTAHPFAVGSRDVPGNAQVLVCLLSQPPQRINGDNSHARRFAAVRAGAVHR